MSLPISIVMPVYNEGEAIVPHLDAILNVMDGPFEILVVHDTPDDTTVPALARYEGTTVIPTLNTYGRGPANAIRFGLNHAQYPIAVVTMADGSDDVSQIVPLAQLVSDGAAIACASRYMRGGKQIGGPAFKGFLSRLAGVSLFHLGRVGTHDATNSYKAYRTSFIHDHEIESRAGFELAIELVAKARRSRERVSEIPTTWHDRDEGESNFDLVGWFPKYLRWYLHALGRKYPVPVPVPKGTSS
jgi:dolichol-phosphate mannosyltransferase